LNKFKRLNQVTASTDKKANILAVNWGLNPGAGVLIFINAIFTGEKNVFMKKNFLNILPP